MSPATRTDEPEPLPLHERPWPWRERLRANPVTAAVWRGGVALAGLLVVAVGLVLIPFPGPGWAIVFGGVLVWALEFAWAGRLLGRGRALLGRWTDWVGGQPLWVKGLISLGSMLVVAAALWVVLWLTGVPGVVPEPWAERLHTWGRVPRQGRFA